ncbi:MAG: type IV toxin-antitoxin system AbiEi family antitoxin domain-containing protein [Propionibacteriaceae bacterium]|jgi:predicted transcriptional regulator of viral defense system|nr:type IV toxin-antitoxin system AbiEi family antitoxin domain-containing protein [Propionibacteriaceae bacterium]
MSLPRQLLRALETNNGTVSTKQANEVGVSNERLRLLVKAEELEHVSFGIYSLPGEFIDTMYIVQLRRPRIIYSHETALFLHDLTDRDPVEYSVTVPAGYNVTTLKNKGFRIASVKREWRLIHNG